MTDKMTYWSFLVAFGLLAVSYQLAQATSPVDPLTTDKELSQKSAASDKESRPTLSKVPMLASNSTLRPKQDRKQDATGIGSAASATSAKQAQRLTARATNSVGRNSGPADLSAAEDHHKKYMLVKKKPKHKKIKMEVYKPKMKYKKIKMKVPVKKMKKKKIKGYLVKKHHEHEM